MLTEIFWIDGRASRTHWWTTVILQTTALLFAAFAFVPESTPKDFALNAIQSPPMIIVTAVLLWTGIVVNIRRWHDRGKSGWWMLIAFIPLIGPSWQTFELGFRPGTEGNNRFGLPPGQGGDVNADVAEPEGSRPSGLAKIDDAYLAEYARNFARQQAEKAQIVAFAGPSPAPPPSFGKRR